jgi:DNA polymerase III sliding clamp (beta) subunit (PCNA family)
VPTRVVFETGTIGDVIRKATQVAPAKVGAAFDSAAGLVFDIDPAAEAKCVVRATDTSLFYLEVVDVLECTGDAVRWRLPSQLLAAVVGGMSTKTSKNITFQQDGKKVEILSGRMKGDLIPITGMSYPDWNVSADIDLVTAPDFGARLQRVEWASASSGDKNELAPMAGVLVNGTHLVATDRYRVARVPCEIPLGEPVLIPAKTLASLTSRMGNVKVGFDGHLFVVMPDSYTQIKTVVITTAFPNLAPVFAKEFTTEVVFPKSELIERVQRTGAFTGSERNPIVQLYLGREEIAVYVTNHEIGSLGDVLEVPGQIEHERCIIRFTPKFLLDALTNAPSEMVTIRYDNDRVRATSPVKFEAPGGYEVWVSPRAETTPAA